MKKIFLSIAFIQVSILLFGQSENQEIKMLSEHGSKNKELSNLLLFQDIDYYNVKFTGHGLKNMYFTLIAKHMWNGKLKKIDTLMHSKNNPKMSNIGGDTLALTLFGSKVDRNKLKLFFRFPMVGLNRKFDATESDDYSLRDIGTDLKIEKNKSFPAFVYMLPYIEENWKNYCGVTQSGVDVENWGKKFNLKHYIIFEMKFED